MRRSIMRLAARMSGEPPRQGMLHASILFLRRWIYLPVPESASLPPGDVVCFGISHPCTTFDNRRMMPVTDDDGRACDVVHAWA